ncbi:MAG: 30S ribosomal protein S16 [Candidatus Pacebacteria bacterium]|nr:30S ribosomal protein S16 [Candidatus Paceibacterota bacterium]
MSVKIRLRRMGKRNQPAHRIVVTDSRKPRDGRFIEILGYYDPRRKMEQIDLERVDKWLNDGAKPSDTVDAIIKRARAGISWGETPRKQEAPKQAAETAPAEKAEATEPERVESQDEAAQPEEQQDTEEAIAQEQQPADENESEK